MGALAVVVKAEGDVDIEIGEVNGRAMIGISVSKPGGG